MRVPPCDQQIRVNAVAWRAREMPDAPKLGMGVRVWWVRVLPGEPGLEDPVFWTQASGTGGCRESVVPRGETTLAGPA